MVFIDSLIPSQSDILPQRYAAIPRGNALIFDATNGINDGTCIRTCREAETQFVSVLEQYIKLDLDIRKGHAIFSGIVRYPTHTKLVSRSIRQPYDHVHDTTYIIALSDDIDAFFIYLLPKSMKGNNALYVLRDRVYDLEYANSRATAVCTDILSLAILFVFAGIDFLPRTFAVPHDSYPDSFLNRPHC